MSEIQFGVNLHAVSSWPDFRQLVQRADELGCDVLAAPDHLGGLAPFAALTAAGAVSARLRLRTYVLNAGFWNAALLAREVATLDLLSGGRAELGLGAGHMKSEHDDARIPWQPAEHRLQALEQLLVETRQRLADETHQLRAVQQPVPLLIGAMSTAGLSLAAQHADIVGFAGLRQVPGSAPGTFTVSSPAETRQRVDQVRHQADGRSYRSDVLLQVVAIGPQHTDTAAQMAAGAPDRLSVEQLLHTPFALFARDADEAADELQRRRQVYGFDCFTTHQPYLEALGQVIAAYRSTDPA